MSVHGWGTLELRTSQRQGFGASRVVRAATHILEPLRKLADMLDVEVCAADIMRSGPGLYIACAASLEGDPVSVRPEDV